MTVESTVKSTPITSSISSVKPDKYLIKSCRNAYQKVELMVKSTVNSTVDSTVIQTPVDYVVNAFASSTVILNTTKAYVSMSP